MSKNLNENIKSLNKKFESLKIQFELYEDRIKISDNYVISNNPKLKQSLKDQYSIAFDWDQKFWYIGKAGIKRLSEKIVKLKTSKDIDILINELGKYIEMIKDRELKNDIGEIFEKNKVFYEAPGAKYNHHNYKGGLLEHTIQTVELALAVNNVIENLIIDQDLLIAGAILHDIGKINCYEYYNEIIEITDIFHKQEHIINGIKIISQEIKSEKLDELIHILASHHNIKEWGSPIEPISNEAWIIHFVENLSSKIMG
ncbi:hypothetical protein LCGC14_0999780 [marine sediment metagenome]|uniref:HD domain-containing protein n=1 Tax=marine sediment metagenome TaxID=412755 RepID=A0A0F9R9I6_9ZZZZ|nr:MAG: 3'-5' exoribonuclease YhaM [Candidatus Lokiarchaeum sp. GC14_75]